MEGGRLKGGRLIEVLLYFKFVIWRVTVFTTVKVKKKLKELIKYTALKVTGQRTSRLFMYDVNI